jgi:protein-L-isoaspartate(D-aspartate) O-methyltransferase
VFMDILMAVLMLFSKPPREPDYRELRDNMVEHQIMARGVKDSRVIGAMMKVPRHLFIPENKRYRAYDDGPLPIGEGQTISQPYIVALMTELLEPQEGDRILEIGTGSGYQAAVLAEIVDTVYSIEIICELQERADSTLKALDYENVITRCGDGYLGWPEAAPFDGVIVTAAPKTVPEPLLEQLNEGAKLVIPVGDYMQYLEVYTRTGDKFERERNVPVRFVPMTGKAEEDDQD